MSFKPIQHRISRWKPSVRCVRVFPALLAWIAIAVVPFLSPACCCQLAQANELAVDVPSCCQSSLDCQSSTTDDCCHHAMACECCDVVKHDCPCDIRDQNVDQLVTTQAKLSSQFESETTADLVAVLPWSASGQQLTHHVDADAVSPTWLMTSGQRCALLCRWLN